MIDKEFLETLVCPQDRTPLRLADAQLMARLNRAIGAGRITNAAGRCVEDSIEGGLIRRACDLLYPIVDDIPVLLAEEAISLDQLRDERKR
ncbi:MAG: Trm112 family protein [Thermoguttaceae bacterium]|jgi:uncharacterized protein YbaR (Trm112 family)